MLLWTPNCVYYLNLPSSKVLHGVSSQNGSLTITLTIRSNSVGKVGGGACITKTSPLELGVVTQGTRNTLGGVDVLTVGPSLALHTHRLTSDVLETRGTLLPEALGGLFGAQVSGGLAPDAALAMGV